MEKDKRLHIRISSQEAEILAQYCKKTMRSQSDVLREMIRALENKKPSSEGRGLNPINFGQLKYEV